MCICISDNQYLHVYIISDTLYNVDVYFISDNQYSDVYFISDHIWMCILPATATIADDIHI